MKPLMVYQISYGYVSRFLDYEIFNFWKILSFSRPRGFPLIPSFLGMIHCLFFEGLKGHRLLGVCQISCLDTAYSVFIKVKDWDLIKPFLSNAVHV